MIIRDQLGPICDINVTYKITHHLCSRDSMTCVMQGQGKHILSGTFSEHNIINVVSMIKAAGPTHTRAIMKAIMHNADTLQREYQIQDNHGINGI